MANIQTQLSEKEKNFCLLYVNAPAPYAGNAEKCFKAIFESPTKMVSSDMSANYSISASELMQNPDIKEYIEKLQELNVVNAATLRPRLTQTLLKIVDECSDSSFEDKFGNPISPAAMRSVSVSAIKELNDMYGIKEDIAHTVKLEGENGAGVVFNVIVPDQKNNDKELEDM